MKFSERVGAVPVKYEPLREEMNADLRNVIWNTVFTHFFSDVRRAHNWQSGEIDLLSKRCQEDFFKLPVDELPFMGRDYQTEIKNFLLTSKWYQVYDFVEWMENWGSFYNFWKKGDRYFEKASRFRNSINLKLEQELSVYRFVGNHILEINSQEEIDEINRAIAVDGENAAVSNHLQAAVSLLSDRENPDYRNSIKESISAVEAAGQILTGDPKATLADTLKKLEKSSNLHGALKNGFSNLYGWASDAEGIRHAMMDQPTLTLADARYMLVTCSAFTNYLISNIKDS